MSINKILCKNNKISLTKADGEWEIKITYPDGHQFTRGGVASEDLDNIIARIFDFSSVEDYPHADLPGIPNYINRMKYILDSEYSLQFNLSDLENRLNISKYRLCHEFSMYIGTSPIKYLTSRRIEAAKTLLVSTELKVYEIGLNVGYDNTNHFINVFKKQTGDTPSEYRHKYT